MGAGARERIIDKLKEKLNTVVRTISNKLMSTCSFWL